MAVMDVPTFERRWGLTVAPRRGAGDGQLCPLCTWRGRRRCDGRHEGDRLDVGGAGVFDHVRWVMRGAEPGILAQPYYERVTGPNLAALTAWCEPRGLSWWVLGESCYHPAAVAVVVFLAGVGRPDYHEERRWRR